MPQNRLFKALENPDRYPHDIDRVRRIETHISCVFLAGPLAYKLKKAVNFGFLDFSTLARRKHFCEEEIRLNSRLAPDIYRRVIPITGRVDDPVVDGQGPVIEYAVEMIRFRQRDLYPALLADNQLSLAQMEQLADQVARFHARASVAPGDGPHGHSDSILGHMLDNFPAITWPDMDPVIGKTLLALKTWTRERTQHLTANINARRLAGRVRECHGDIHLGNIVNWRGQPVIFDGIDFQPDLYWIDVISEIAFLTMDLKKCGSDPLAHRFLNTYLELSSDYCGLALLDYYQVYRAMVRAKVCALTARNDARSAADVSQDHRDALRYIDLANRFSRTARPQLVITFGPSGSGKSTAALKLVDQRGFIRLRSDVERKRLAGLAPLDSSQSSLSGGLYSPGWTARTYRRLLDLAETVLAAGFSVVVDAAFLEPGQRRPFQNLAARLGVAFHILQLHASPATLQDRVTIRSGDPSEAGPAVLAKQLARGPGLDATERIQALVIDSESDDRHWLSKIGRAA